MTYYFNLQFKRINRHLKALGFNVVLAYILVGLVFIGASQILFEKIKFAEYIYAALALLAAYSLSEPNRNTYLQGLFHKKDYHIVRLIENSVLILPFCIFLLYQHFYSLAIALLFIAHSISFFRFTFINRFIVPTPFYKNPFEFIVGFRKNVFFFIGYFILVIISVYVDNFNLGIFALMLCLLTCLNFYAKPEPLFYIWTHAFSPAQFLTHKIQRALLHVLFISFPFALALVIFYPAYWYIIGLMMLLGMLYLILMLLGKYAFYPAEVNIIQVLALALSILFPPFLGISLPYFYMKAKQNLSLTIV